MHKADATAFAVEDKIAFFTQGSRSGNPGLEGIAPLGHHRELIQGEFRLFKTTPKASLPPTPKARFPVAVPGRCTLPILQQLRQSALSGRLIIAQRFIAGKSRIRDRVREVDDWNSGICLRSVVRCTDSIPRPFIPAVNCWAIVSRPLNAD
jgi:hypothetical protein